MEAMIGAARWGIYPQLPVIIPDPRPPRRINIGYFSKS
jgi:hypothetical protein